MNDIDILNLERRYGLSTFGAAREAEERRDNPADFDKLREDARKISWGSIEQAVREIMPELGYQIFSNAFETLSQKPANIGDPWADLSVRTFGHESRGIFLPQLASLKKFCLNVWGTDLSRDS